MERCFTFTFPRKRSLKKIICEVVLSTQKLTLRPKNLVIYTQKKILEMLKPYFENVSNRNVSF